MRDMNRITPILEQLAEQWKRVPDWRLGQLFANLERRYGDLFFLEDDKFINTLTAYLNVCLGEEEYENIDENYN